MFRYRILSCVLGFFIYIGCFGLRYLIFGWKPRWWLVGVLNSIVGYLAFELGPVLPSFPQAIYGFMLLSVAVLCMVLIIEPSNDYGVLLLSSLFSIQVALIVYKTKTFDISYVYTALVPVVCMLAYHCQMRREVEEVDEEADEALE